MGTQHCEQQVVGPEGAIAEFLGFAVGTGHLRWHSSEHTPEGSREPSLLGVLIADTDGVPDPPARRRVVVWESENAPGMELSSVRLASDHLQATGVAIGTEPEPYRLEYELETGSGFMTSALRVRSEGRGWRRRLELLRSSDGVWTCSASSDGEADFPPPGGSTDPFAEALDCDLGRSPLTNSMPVLRHGLLDGGGPIDFVMAWVSVPDLVVHRSEQRYTFVRREGERSIVEYQSTGRSFVADLTFDADGLVLLYPGLARRVAG